MRRNHPRPATLVLLVGLLLTLVGAGLVPDAALAATRDTPSVPVGYDISNYQCTQTLPALPQFAVIEVVGAPYNHTTSATCLQNEYAYAAAAAAPPEFYLYAADTANRGGSNPITKTCGGVPTPACVQAFAQGAAQDAVAQLDAAAIPVSASSWWVDVECSTSTCPDWIANRPDLNQAAVRGYVAGLRSRPDRVSSVGFYSTNYQWSKITGQIAGSPAFGVEGLPVWYASAASSPGAGAAAYCGQVGFTGGQIALVQSAPINYVGSTSQIDPDVLCAPMIATVTQNALAGGLVMASGVGSPDTNLTLVLADTFTPQRPLVTVTTDDTGHWTQGFHLGSNGVLTVSGPDGATMSVPVAVTAKVAVSKTRGAGRDRLGHCIDRLDGSVYPYVPGTQVVLRGARDKEIGFGNVTKLGTIGSWKANVIVGCGQKASTKVTESGLVPGSGVRFANDGRTSTVYLPLNKTPAKAATKR